MDRLYLHSVTVPAGTLQAAPHSEPFPLEDAYLILINLILPKGHSGYTGIRILRSGQEIVPYSNTKFIVSNDRVIPISFRSAINASGLVIQAYNTDVYDHTFYLEATITDTPPVTASALQLETVISPDVLSSTT